MLSQLNKFINKTKLKHRLLNDPATHAKSSTQYQIRPICCILVLAFLNDHVINVRMLLVTRRDSNPAISTPMKKAVTIKALKNKDRMSVETALEIFSPDVQRAIRAEDTVITIVSEVYTVWKQNRPGTVVGPLDVDVHQKTGTIFFTDRNANQIMCNLHCPSMITSVAGESRPGSRDGKNSLFPHPSGMCIYENLLFACDSSNASIRVLDISRLAP